LAEQPEKELFMKRIGQRLLRALRRNVFGRVPPPAPAPRDWRGGQVVISPQPKRRDPYDTLRPGDLRICWRQGILRRVEEMPSVLGEVAANLDCLGYSAKDVLGVRLALEEAIVNGLRHGNGGDPSKCVRIRCSAGRDMMVAEVEDEGLGFNPGDVPDPTLPENVHRTAGRGLLLMRHYMTWVYFSRRGNCLTLCKLRSNGRH
jgi:serine/threonine-protein kinase RsbW